MRISDWSSDVCSSDLRTVRELLRSGVNVKRSQLRAGDLMIYRWKPRQLHVAVYLDAGHIVHASPSAGEVVVTALDDRQSVVEGKSVSERVDLGGRRIMKKKNNV